MDTDIGTELFAGYENDFNLIVADISSKLQGLQDQDGESRKAAIRAAERAVEEAEEIVSIPSSFTSHLTLSLDWPNGDGSHEYTECTTTKSICSSPWT
jgi:Vesicle transport v-SNARE protein N-terminus